MNLVDSKFWQKIGGVLVALVLLSIPSNLFFKFLESSAYVNGVLVDYLIPKLYLVDLFLVPLFVFGVVQFIRNKKIRIPRSVHLLTGMLLLLGIIVLQFFTQNVMASLWVIAHLFLVVGASYGISQLKLKNNVVSVVALGSLLLQTGLAVFQRVFQQSLLPYQYLGETDLHSYAGLARTSWNGVEYVLPYGTTAHPNILAGMSVLFLYLILSSEKQWNAKAWLAIGLSTMLVILTQSFSAAVALMLVIATHAWWPKVASISSLAPKILVGWVAVLSLIPVLLSQFAYVYHNNESLVRRDYLNRAGLEIWADNPITGVGLNQYTTQVEQYAQHSEVVRFIQPAHHVGILLLAEIGLLGIGVVVLIGWQFSKRLSPQQQSQLLKLLVMLTPIIVLDHYLITNMPTITLLAVVITTQVTWNSRG